MIGALREFLRLEAAAGLILVAAAAAAMVLANSPLAWLYTDAFDTHLIVGVGSAVLDKPILLWVNDGLMAIFFLLVGLEIKREVMSGHLSSLKLAALPAIAAVGGMAVPAAVYVMFNVGSPDTLSGWAIPAATDIAFALGVLALLGQRVPVILKVFLTALAIIDDLGAIVIIALFYTNEMSALALGVAAAAIVGLVAMNLAGVRRVSAFGLVGLVLWVAVLKSGVHATLAGVVIAFAIPLRDAEGDIDHGPLRTLEHNLHVWVAYGILPLFAFANAGVSFAGMTLGTLLSPVPLGIALGLFVGKQVGVSVFAYVAVRAGLSRLPDGVSWLQFHGVAILTGIGFTMSLFIGNLAFTGTDQAAEVRLGVLVGSLLSAVVGFAVLRTVRGPVQHAPPDL